MTLADVKKKVLALIEELNDDSQYLTDDVDIQAKINYVINQIQFEVARVKKIHGMESFTVTADQEMQLSDIDSNLYQINKVKGLEYEIDGDWITFKEAGTVKIYYFKYPQVITSTTADSFIFELAPDAIEVLVYGVAADLLKSDVSSDYGVVYANRYKEMMQNLDPRLHSGSIYFSTTGEGVI